MRKPLAGSLLVLLLAAVATAAEVDRAVLEAEAHRVEVLANTTRAAVAIFSETGEGGGSGVLISPDGYALSNFHVTRECGVAMKCGLPDGEVYDAVIVGIDPVGDVALIKLLGRDDFPYAPMADSDLVQLGDWVFAVGNPFLLATDFQPTVTYGIISGVHRYQYGSGTLLEYTDCLQTDASINPGNSGGPLFNSEGELIGINGRGSFEKRGRVNVGVGYAISINQIKNFLGCLHAGRIVDHATLGATVSTNSDGRVIVSDVLDDSDAYRRGLRYGDEIVRFGGRSIRTVNGFKNVLGIFPQGWRVAMSYRRSGKTYDVLVRLAGVHSPEELLRKTEGRVEMPQPQPEEDRPMPDDEPDDEPADDGQPREMPRLPNSHQGAAPAKLAENVEPHYEARRGYANYHFNELHRDRVWQAFTSRGDFTSAGGSWGVEGTLAPAGDARFELSDDAVACELPGGRLRVPLDEGLTTASEPPGSGGMLAALGLWRRLLVEGPQRFGNLEYLGVYPLAGQDELAEVLAGTFGGVECQFYFSTTTGSLLAVEMYRQADQDPCELLWGDYRQVKGRWLPHQLEVRYGDHTYAAFQFDRWTLEEAP